MPPAGVCYLTYGMSRLLLTVVFTGLVLFYVQAQSNKPTRYQVYDLNGKGLLLDKGWKFKAGDDPAYAFPNYDDRHWQPIDPTLPLQQLDPIQKAGIGWLRLRLDKQLLTSKRILQVYQMLGSEVYLNGQLVRRYGQVSPDPRAVRASQPAGDPISLPADLRHEVVLAVRVAYQPLLSPFFQAPFSYSGFAAYLTTVPELAELYNDRILETAFNIVRVAVLLFLSILHGAIFYHNRPQRANLYLAIYSAMFAISYLLGGLPYIFTSVHLLEFMFISGFVLSIVGLWYYVLALYTLFSLRPATTFYCLTAIGVLSVLTSQLPGGPLSVLGGPFVWVLFVAESLRITVKALRKNRRGAHIIATGQVIALLSLGGFVLLYDSNLAEWVNRSLLPITLFNIGALSVPIAISVYLAREFAFDNLNLQLQVKEVRQLSARSLAQEQEKQQLLAAQNEVLERQVNERTAALEQKSRQLTQSLEHLQATQTQLIQKEKMASLGELTAGIAHEIQNPLNFVNNFSEVSAELVGELRQEETSAERDVDLIGELLDDLTHNLQKISHWRRFSAFAARHRRHC